jgi:hypothetical protein
MYRRADAMNRFRNSMAGLALVAVAMAAGASTTLSGNFGDLGNGALVGSDLGAAIFADDNAIANNVALYTFTVGGSGLVSLVSTGFAAGGVDPYFSLFSGTGAGATFLDSNYAQAFSTGGDFNYSAVLAAGSYEVAIGTFANMSFAENLGSGTLGDGFIALGDPNSLHNGTYLVTLTTPVSEPSTVMLMAFGMAGLAIRARRFRFSTKSSSHCNSKESAK